MVYELTALALPGGSLECKVSLYSLLNQDLHFNKILSDSSAHSSLQTLQTLEEEAGLADWLKKQAWVLGRKSRVSTWEEGLTHAR